MKIRTDFVTNSSSSSFVLAFKDEKDYRKFEQSCDEWGYKQVASLIKRCRKRADMSMDEIKESAIQHIRHWLTWEQSNAYCNARIDPSLEFTEKLRLEDEIKATPEYHAFIESVLAETRYAEYVEQINQAALVVNDCIWDSNGGLLEYAIRNGLLREYTFRPWLVYQEDIG